MALKQLSMTDARREFLRLPERLARTPERAISVTSRGEPVLAVMPWDLYESIIETLDILADRDLASTLRDSLEDLRAGRLIDHDEVGHRLGL
jgi:prevent-host-death family protein